MKICHAVYSLEMGGAEVLVAQLCRQQRALGHEVSVCAYSKLGSIGEVLQSEGFDIYVPGEAHPFRTMQRYLQHFLKLKPDVVHCHNPAPTLQAALVARIAGVARVISTRHSLVAPPYEVREELKYNMMAFFCDWVAGVCETTCQNLRGTPLAHTEKIVCIFNGSTPVTRTAERSVNLGALRLLFVGRLAEVKDLPTLLRAVAFAREQMSNLEFWVVGDGAIRGSLEKIAKELAIDDCVKFWGQQLDTATFFSQVDVFAMSSVSEGLPMSMLQAMSVGLPVIATDVGGMAEVVRMSEAGLLSPVGDARAMAANIVKLASDGDLQRQFSGKALAAFERYFTLQCMTEEYMKLYQF